MSWINDHIRTVPDFPLRGIMFRDLTTLFQDSAAFKRMVDELVGHYEGRKFDKIVGIEARGFILGGLMAYQMNAGFVPIRKAEKLPYETRTQSYSKEYGTDFLELHIDGVDAGERILLVDDLIATGGTAEAAISLIRAGGAVVEDACFVVDLPYLGGADLVRHLGCALVALTQFGGD